VLGHRLAEVLHRQNELAADRNLRERVTRALDRLLREEGAVMLRPGMAFELAQLREQLANNVERLAKLLHASKLSVADAESSFSVTWRGYELRGQIDLLLTDSRGRDVVVDLKWGSKTYRDKLTSGQAIQLAVYAAARRLATEAKVLPPAGYFSLSKGNLMTVDAAPFKEERPVMGPALNETWVKLEVTVERAEKVLAEGRIPVTGVRRSLPLVAALGVSERECARYLDLEREVACGYCHYGPLCGRAWEGAT
jgi:hypothetical protein